MFPEFYSDLDEDEKKNIPEGKIFHSCNIMWAHERISTSKCVNDFENVFIALLLSLALLDYANCMSLPCRDPCARSRPAMQETT